MPLQSLPSDLSDIIERDNDSRSDITPIFDLQEEFREESRYKRTETETAPILASLFASYVTRKASENAFKKSKRSTLSTDIISEIGDVIYMFEEQVSK